MLKRFRGFFNQELTKVAFMLAFLYCTMINSSLIIYQFKYYQHNIIFGFLILCKNFFNYFLISFLIFLGLLLHRFSIYSGLLFLLFISIICSYYFFFFGVSNLAMQLGLIAKMVVGELVKVKLILTLCASLIIGFIVISRQILF